MNNPHFEAATEAGNAVAKPYRHPENTRNIIEAALPHLRAMIAQEILDHINTEPTYMHVIEWRDAMETAAQIALGDTK